MYSFLPGVAVTRVVLLAGAVQTGHTLGKRIFSALIRITGVSKTILLNLRSPRYSNKIQKGK
ncbi:MAG: hypothetical protein BAJATHORv1_90059 [Candidatus Thorarchaeota archaeon]|nr:MAG: hypothetical protein BAJATHORv1_90059 [Candidatus Thorarchaeota archaeon]